MAFGRVGCFLNGCCFGLLTRNDFPLGVTFPVGSPAHEAQWALGLLDIRDMKPLPVHPVQLYQASHDLLLFLLLLWYLRRPTTPVGIGMPLLVVLYGVGRFFLEGLRGDQASTFSGLTVGQNSSLVLVAVSGTFLAFMLVKMRKGLGVGVRIPKKTI